MLNKLNSLFRRRIPPRNLAKLAQSYSSKNTTLVNTSSINLFQHPPAWTCRAFAPSERAIKLFLKKKRDIRDQAANESKKCVTEKLYPRAAIACGLGPDGERESRSRRWKHKRIKFSAIAVSIGAIALGLVGNRSELLIGSKMIVLSTRKILNTAWIQDTDGNKRKEETDICINPKYSALLEPKLDDERFEMMRLQEESNEIHEKKQHDTSENDFDQSEMDQPESFKDSGNIFSKFFKSVRRSLSEEAEMYLL